MPRPNWTIAAIGVLSAALVLSGCGRKGPLDPPPSASVQQNGQAAGEGAAERADQQVELGPDGKPMAGKGPKRRLPLDFLID